MDTSMHNPKRASYRFHNTGEPFGFATLTIGGSDKDEATFFFLGRNDHEEFLLHLIWAAEAVRKVMVDGEAPPADEEE